MIADIHITEKSFGPKQLMHNIRFSIDDKQKVGIIGRNGVGKSTLFGILAGTDTDYTGLVNFQRGATIVATAQEHHGDEQQTVIEYILAGLPEYSELHKIITTYPDTMGDDIAKIEHYTEALERFGQKGFYHVEELLREELRQFQLEGTGDRPLSTLSGGQKRLVEIVKVMHSQAHLALLDEPTNHMDYVAKQQFLRWLEGVDDAVLIITHDRDVLREVDRIIELKDGYAQSFNGNYDAYLKQNAVHTSSAMNEFEMIEKRMTNLRAKVLDYQRLKEKSRNPGTIANFKRLENQARDELAELESKQKPTFWIDQDSVEELNYKTAGQYQKFKARNIRMNIGNEASRSKRVLVEVKDLALGYGDNLLFEGINIDLREGEALELRGRNGAGKTTLIRTLLDSRSPLLSPKGRTATQLNVYEGTIHLDLQARVGVYEQEVSPQYFDLTLAQAIERIYLDRDLSVSDTLVRQLMSDYLFTESDGGVKVSMLSGGQKARLQIIAMLANSPQLLILDEPTNHLDLPSIEELEQALARYSGAIMYVSHDSYFRQAMGGEVVQIGAE